MGIESDVNVAMVMATEASPLLQNQGTNRLTGDINFYFTDPTLSSADVTLNQIEVIAVEPTDWAMDQNGNAAVTEYRVAFADWRNRMVWPRGGYLYAGEVNTQPVTGGEDVNGNPYLNPQQLAQQCVQAMGLPSSTAPNSLSDWSPIYNLEWRGAHAPTELAKIVHTTNHCVWCDMTGKLQIAQIGSGQAPTIPTGRQIIGTSFGALDRRPSVVVFSSAPIKALSRLFVWSGEELICGNDSPAARLGISAESEDFPPVACSVMLWLSPSPFNGFGNHGAARDRDPPKSSRVFFAELFAGLRF